MTAKSIPIKGTANTTLPCSQGGPLYASAYWCVLVVYYFVIRHYINFVHFLLWLPLAYKRTSLDLQLVLNTVIAISFIHTVCQTDTSAVRLRCLQRNLLGAKLQVAIHQNFQDSLRTTNVRNIDVPQWNVHSARTCFLGSVRVESSNKYMSESPSLRSYSNFMNYSC
jgi:hypothetical protein